MIDDDAEELALAMVRRYRRDRDRLDYYYYDQDLISDEYYEEEGKTTKKVPGSKILSSLFSLFRKTDTTEEDDGTEEEMTGPPKFPSAVVAKCFSPDATYVDGNYYR